MSREQKILDIITQSILNLNATTKNMTEFIPTSGIEASCEDVITLVAEVDPLVAGIMEKFMNSHMTSTDDDFPFDDEKMNYMAMEWLEYCEDVLKECVNG